MLSLGLGSELPSQQPVVEEGEESTEGLPSVAREPISAAYGCSAVRAPARRLESAGGDLSQRNRLVRVMTEETSIKKFDDLPPGLVRAYSHPQIRRQSEPPLLASFAARLAGVPPRNGDVNGQPDQVPCKSSIPPALSFHEPIHEVEVQPSSPNPSRNPKSGGHGSFASGSTLTLVSRV